MKLLPISIFKNKYNGFSTLEVLVSISMISILVVVCFKLLQSQLVQYNRSNIEVTAEIRLLKVENLVRDFIKRNPGYQSKDNTIYTDKNKLTISDGKIISESEYKETVVFKSSDFFTLLKINFKRSKSELKCEVTYLEAEKEYTRSIFLLTQNNIIL